MFELTKPYWNPTDAPTSNFVTHGTPALAALLSLAQSEPKRMLFGAPPSVTMVSDVPTGASKADGIRMYAQAPEWADRARVIVCASGGGNVYAQHETNGTGVAVEIPGDPASTAVSLYVVADGGEGEITEAAPSATLLEMDPGALNRIAIWKDSASVVVWSIALLWQVSQP